MKFHKQEFLYDPASKTRGSCYPTVLACLLDLELGQVPNFQLFYWSKEEEQNIIKTMLQKYCNGSYESAEEYQKKNFDREKSRMLNHWVNTLEFWLASKGYIEEYIMRDEFDEWLKNNPDKPYMVKGESSRGVGHVVIYQNGQMIHDPHPSNEGLKTLSEEPYTHLKKVTEIKYITTHIDEFNYVYSSNLDAYFSRLNNEKPFYYTTTFSEFDIMFNEYDKVFVKKIEAIPGLGSIDSIASDRTLIDKLHAQGVRNILTYDNVEFITDTEVESIRNNEHVYKYTFCSSAKLLKEGNMKFINPKKNDYKAKLSLLKSLNTEDKKIVAINGRNLKKIPARNQLFLPVIDYLISQGYFVVNLTINPPKLNYPKDSYYEIPDANLSYSDMTSFFLISDCVLSVADSGGVNVHILTEANFIFLGPGGWIDNPQFGYDGISLLETRKNNTNFYTEHLQEYTLPNLVLKIKEIPSRNTHYSFFDESKLENL